MTVRVRVVNDSQQLPHHVRPVSVKQNGFKRFRCFLRSDLHFLLADAAVLLWSAAVGAEAAGSYRSSVRAGRCWCWFCSACPAGATAATPGRRWSLLPGGSAPCPRTPPRLWPAYQPPCSRVTSQADLRGNKASTTSEPSRQQRQSSVCLTAELPELAGTRR